MSRSIGVPMSHRRFSRITKAGGKSIFRMAAGVALFSLAACGNIPGPSSTPSQRAGLESKYIDIGAPLNIRLHYLRAGDPTGRRVIFVHGTPGSAYAFTDYLVNVPSGFEFISVDRPGFGKSGPDGAVVSLRMQALALRPLVETDEETFAAVARRACRINPAGELLAFTIGIAFFFGIEGRYEGNPEYHILSTYVYVAGLIMFGIIGWSVYGALMITRLTNEILRLPIHIDIFETEALVPIGRQSLYLALTFVGATLLSLFFIVSPDNLRDFLSLENIIIYSILILLTITVFFLNMHRTHSLLTTVKKQQIRLTDQNLARTYYTLQDLIANNQDTSAASTRASSMGLSRGPSAPSSRLSSRSRRRLCSTPRL